MENLPVYRVVKLDETLTINGNWLKLEWQGVEALELNYFMGEVSKYQTVVRAKLIYDANNIYVIFHFIDRYIRCLTRETNGPVWEDSCVEFFFSPDSNFPLKYFNLEPNCGGTVLMFYNLIPRTDFNALDAADINQIEIAHTLPKIIDPGITVPFGWTIEYRISFDLLKKNAKVSQPDTVVPWMANFYKIADKSSNPHYQTLSFVDQIKPDFHLPSYFGKIKFK